MNEILFATANPHKTNEVRKILSGTFKIIDLADISFKGKLVERETSLEGNAISKARQALTATGFNCCFAEDSGLEVKALEGKPGVFSARFAGPERDNEENMKKVLRLLENSSDRSARFKTVIAFIDEDGIQTFEGIVNGVIANKPAGDSGFGYDPIFIPEGFDKTFAQLPPETKNKISHRSKAMSKFIDWLKTYQN